MRRPSKRPVPLMGSRFHNQVGVVERARTFTNVQSAFTYSRTVTRGAVNLHSGPWTALVSVIHWLRVRVPAHGAMRTPLNGPRSPATVCDGDERQTGRQ